MHALYARRKTKKTNNRLRRRRFIIIITSKASDSFRSGSFDRIESFIILLELRVSWNTTHPPAAAVSGRIFSKRNYNNKNKINFTLAVDRGDIVFLVRPRRDYNGTARKRARRARSRFHYAIREIFILFRGNERIYDPKFVLIFITPGTGGSFAFSRYTYFVENYYNTLRFQFRTEICTRTYYRASVISYYSRNNTATRIIRIFPKKFGEFLADDL